MYNPPHPGLTIKEDILPALGVNPTEAANLMGVSPSEFIKVINGESPITPELALLLQSWLEAYRGGGASIWLRQQERYDQWQLR